MTAQQTQTQTGFQRPLASKTLTFGVMSKRLPTKGNMAWEYNPFRNLRLSSPQYYFREKFFTPAGLLAEFGLTKGNTEAFLKWFYEKYKKQLSIPEQVFDEDNWKWAECKSSPEDSNTFFSHGKSSSEEDPILYDTNQLIDFETDQLNFDLNHPVDILPQYSYDGSVNLILNDGKNPPKLINSRFSPLGRNKYQIVDRKGDNDTNIYDQGDSFDSDTSLYKTYVGIPSIRFVNVYQSGNLSVGNYHFYFRYVDADGNETDFVGESGLVSIFKGVALGSVVSGFRDENAFKSVQFKIENVDPAYQYINVYYSRSTSDIDQNAAVSAYRIDQKYMVDSTLTCNILITGDESKVEITTAELNPIYQIMQNVQSQTSCQNMLFFGNVHNQEIKYDELRDLSLYFTAEVGCKDYEPVSHEYSGRLKDTYIDPAFIYKYTGYQKNELYRLGVVYIMKNGSLSPVFNIRGADLEDNRYYTECNLYDDNGIRTYINYDETTGLLVTTTSNDKNSTTEDSKDSTEENSENKNSSAGETKTIYSLENVYGVVKVFSNKDEFKNIFGIKVTLQEKKKDEVLDLLQKNNVRGFFFVRQKRMPLRLCQAFVTGVDQQSNTPMLYVDSNVSTGSADIVDEGSPKYITERFLTDDKLLVHTFEDRLYPVKTSQVHKYCAICPEYDINGPYLNSLFNGNEYKVQQVTEQTPFKQDARQKRHFYLDEFTEASEPETYGTNIVGVEDNTKLIEVNSKMFSARAGEAEEAFRYEYINTELKSTDSVNLIRGSFGPYLALDGYNIPGTLVNIYINDYLTMTKQRLFQLRYKDKSPFYAISDRFSLEDWKDKTDEVLYRGDSYICTFTHRFNRNFQDPSAPTNSQIVDENCWKDNYEVTDNVVKKENFEKINLGDVNAVKLGMWVTFPIVSSFNLNIRSLDDSNTDEAALNGHGRTFFPYSGMSADGSYKTPEALCYNKGFAKSLSERYNYEFPDVPAIKNDFTNRISYSDVHIHDAFKNGFRTFQGQHYRDYPKTYGQITKILELNGNLLCVFEHAVALISVNERVLAGEGSGGNIYINTSNVLPENPVVLSNAFGSQWKDSIVKTDRFVYGVDTVGKKIWRTNAQTFECISDFKVQQFLNQNISLSERELDPIIGIRDVKTHFNKFKNDVMFTFYDNLYGFEEKVWNLCFNENVNQWVTFYSWIPSYSENIYNQFFSFDRNTSKWISKLGASQEGSSFAEGVVLSNNIIDNNAGEGSCVGELSLANKVYPETDNITVTVTYSLESDIYGNSSLFEIKYNEETKKPCLYLNKVVKATDLCTEMYQRGTKSSEGYEAKVKNLQDEKQKVLWINNCIATSNYIVYKEEGKRVDIENKPHSICYEKLEDGTKKVALEFDPHIIYLLRVKAHLEVTYKETPTTLEEAYIDSFKNSLGFNGGDIESVIAVTTQYNLQFLSTDFWRHGQSGIIDITEDIQPTYWYGKQHPFEFEFVMADTPDAHKIIDNLEIISNSAAPESFHYEVIGDCYDFAKDKKNMYIRQEATKELYQENGVDISYDHDYYTLKAIHRHRKDDNGNDVAGDNYDKSTLLPLYYSRIDTIDEIEDSYHRKTDEATGHDYSALAGGEIVRDETTKEYHIRNHAEAVNITDLSKGRLRGNMHYKEDKWYVQVNPVNIVQRNEGNWAAENCVGGEDIDSSLIPIELNQNPTEKVLTQTNREEIKIPANSEKRAFSRWDDQSSQTREVKIKDKWVKIRVRYKGDNLAIISAVNTLFSISYS